MPRASIGACLLTAVVVGLGCVVAGPIAVGSGWAATDVGSVSAAAATATTVQAVAGADLQAVACPTVTTCVAVGLTSDAEQAIGEGAINVDGGVVVTITDGVPGPVQLVPEPSELYAIACPTSTLCEAVGSGSFGTADGAGGLMVTIVPGAANVVQSVTETNTTNLDSVACATTTLCEAATTPQSNTSGEIVTIVNGVPNAAQTVDFPVTKLACSSATTCVAVGSPDNYDTSGQVGVVTIVNGVAGTADVVPGYFDIAGIACPDTSTCEAVGDYYYGLQGLLTEPGVRGAVLPIVNGVPGEASLTPGIRELLGVACASGSSCRAVGYQNRAIPESLALMAPITDGTPDAAEPVSGTGPLGNVELLSVACPNATTCEAVGIGQTGEGPTTGLTVAISPGTPTPVPPTIANFTYPVDGQTAVSTNEAFSWSTVPAAQAYRLTAGTTPGATNLADSGVLSPYQYTYDEPVMPPGPTLYATIYTELDNVWMSQSISFTVAASQASFTSPLDFQDEVDPTQTFTWSTIPQAQGYIVVIGMTRFGNNVANSGLLPANQLSFTPPILPPNAPLYATLLTEVNGAFSRYQAIAFTTGPVGATFTQPVNGEIGVTGGWFSWTPRAQAQSYFLVIGTTPFGTKVYSSGLMDTYNEADLPALPRNETLYATLLTKIRGTWFYQAIIFNT